MAEGRRSGGRRVLLSRRPKQDPEREGIRRSPNELYLCLELVAQHYCACHAVTHLATQCVLFPVDIDDLN